MTKKESDRKYYLKNREKIIARTNKYAKTIGKSKQKEYSRNYYIHNREKEKARTREYIKNNKEKWKKTHINSRLKRQYGITIEQKNLLLLTQQSRCKICRNEFRNDRDCHIDHDHKTNKIRGLLCHYCNTALGLFKENKYIINNAITYLEEFE